MQPKISSCLQNTGFANEIYSILISFMPRRHLTRTVVLQSLYEWDFYHQKKDLIAIMERNLGEFAPGLDDEHIQFMWGLAKNIASHLKEVDTVIVKAAPEWPLDKIAIIDRNILRIGLSELLFSNRDEVPPKVAINEAIELAKSYGGSNGAKFVNGVLGTMYRQVLGDEKPKEKKTVSPEPATKKKKDIKE